MGCSWKSLAIYFGWFSFILPSFSFVTVIFEARSPAAQTGTEQNIAEVDLELLALLLPLLKARIIVTYHHLWFYVVLRTKPRTSGM